MHHQNDIGPQLAYSCPLSNEAIPKPVLFSTPQLRLTQVNTQAFSLKGKYRSFLMCPLWDSSEVEDLNHLVLQCPSLKAQQDLSISWNVWYRGWDRMRLILDGEGDVLRLLLIKTVCKFRLRVYTAAAKGLRVVLEGVGRWKCSHTIKVRIWHFSSNIERQRDCS